MELMKSLLLKLIIASFLVIIFVRDIVVAQDDYYINTYLATDSGIFRNALLKIDLRSRRVADSLAFYINGEFLQKRPLSLANFDRGNYSLDFIINGLSGKNSEMTGQVNTHYFVINNRILNIVRQDSLIGAQLTRIRQVRGDSIFVDLIDDQSGGWRRANYRMERNGLDLREIDRQLPHQNDHIIIGDYRDPITINNMGNRKYYYDLVDGEMAVLFAADSLGTILNEHIVGNISQETIIIGFNTRDSLIYYATLKFKLLSTDPEYSSNDSIRNEIIRLNANSFVVVDSLSLEPGIAYFANEIGAADFVGDLLVYYFSKGDGYKRFDPAYMLIFDTRTNEATWLRVGWR